MYKYSKLAIKYIFFMRITTEEINLLKKNVILLEEIHCDFFIEIKNMLIFRNL